jgi:tetratricopeptide (TPR) repeat protein
MYIEATKLDQYLAIAYFQEGVSNFLLGEFEEALGNFNDALLVIREFVTMLTEVPSRQYLHQLRTTWS